MERFTGDFSEVGGLAFLLSSGMGGLHKPLARVQGLAEEATSGCLINTGKGIEVDLYADCQETLLGTFCGKGRKVYQVFLNNWIMFLERRGGGSKAVGEN